MSRRWFVPEEVQVSSMDCGPVVLQAALSGFGIGVDLGRLRTAVATDVDGTSIDTLEDAANALGLSAVQTVVPLEHLFIPEACPLPFVVVVAQADGRRHFVLVWRRVGRWYQVLDPARGRRWLTARDLTAQVYRHATRFHAGVMTSWLASPPVAGGLATRMVGLGFDEAAVEELIVPALSDPARFGALEAATRQTAELVRTGAVRRGSSALAVHRALLAQPLPPDEDAAVSVRPEGVVGTGAVVLFLDKGEGRPAPPARYASVLREGPPPPSPLLSLVSRVWPGFLPWSGVVAVVAALGAVLQAALLRAFLDAGLYLQTPTTRTGAVVAVVALSLVLLAIGWSWGLVVARMARTLETRLRTGLHAALPRVPVSFFATRPAADVAERAHAVVGLRALPGGVATVVAETAGLLGAVLAITVLDPWLFPLALFSAAASVGMTLLVHPFLASREMRRQTFDGTLSRSWLDAMRGTTAVRAHGGAESLRREHEDVLVGWGEAAEDALRASVVAGVVQGLIGIGLTAAMVGVHLLRAEHAGATLLLVFWAIGMPRRGQALAAAARALPMLENLARRVLDVIEASAEPPRAEALPPGPLSLDIHGLRVGQADPPRLTVDALDIPAGSHVAIVGASGAGKSTLLGVLLGFVEHGEGGIRINGVDHGPAILADLRARTAWLDPSQQLWNESLLDNLRYGSDEGVDLDEILRAAGLLDVLAGLDGGLAGGVGENGGRLSGGQGQRVRLGRVLGRAGVDLVLLDEPFRGLDREARRTALARVRAWWPGATVLCVSHDVSDTTDFDRVLVVEDGRIIEDGAPSDLLARRGTYATLVEADRQAFQVFGGEGWRRWSLADGALVEASSVVEAS